MPCPTISTARAFALEPLGLGDLVVLKDLREHAVDAHFSGDSLRCSICR